MVPSLPLHIHLFDHHLGLVTSSILVIINSKPRQVNKALEIQLKIYTKSNVKSPIHHVAKSPIIKPRPSHQQSIINLQKSPPKPRPSHQQKIISKTSKASTKEKTSKASKCINQESSPSVALHRQDPPKLGHHDQGLQHVANSSKDFIVKLGHQMQASNITKPTSNSNLLQVYSEPSKYIPNPPKIRPKTSLHQDSATLLSSPSPSAPCTKVYKC